MSAVLVNAVKDMVRARFTRQQLLTVDLYGGEFNATEVDYKGFACPAVLLALLGWQPSPEHGRHARQVRLAAFVVTKHAQREQRMLEASTLAEALCLVLRQWQPSLPAEDGVIYRLDAAPSAENLYSRAVDAKGLALWLVSWDQTFVPGPGANPDALFDLLQVDIADMTRQGRVPAPAPGPTGLVVTEDVTFKTPL